MLNATDALVYSLLAAITALVFLTVGPTAVLVWLAVREQRAARRDEEALPPARG